MRFHNKNIKYVNESVTIAESLKYGISKCKGGREKENKGSVLTGGGSSCQANHAVQDAGSEANRPGRPGTHTPRP